MKIKKTLFSTELEISVDEVYELTKRDGFFFDFFTKLFRLVGINIK